ncbi:hypothetical protein BGZ76_000569 [Entomortierella beljakovae]|nr:hypothetical protein BGZ76_000569 [Entomortierella beljakovae]
MSTPYNNNGSNSNNNNNKAEDLLELEATYESSNPSNTEVYNEKKSRKGILSVNPVRAVTKGVTQGSQAVRGGISQVEKGVNNVGNTLTKVPGVKHGVSFFADYRKFMDRGNVIDLAVAVVIGAAFTSIVTSLVTDIITPILALASGKNLEENFIIMKKCENATITPAGRNTKTEVTEKSCDYCNKKVPISAVRCPECTTWLDWDACAKAKNMSEFATRAFQPATMNANTPFVDYAPGSQPVQSSLERF